ncbi:hypothetical protein M378DRAFT_637951 [Amanita muscaria Koide BX008]|uniref:Uncharacterized protein n=1 Tax=Amanita muscaria (strain Koide BX008) TaxID=946122 RepID=A0A0C2TBQ8_AMAMK|nr:hypothetical protein M378DRAFT_637951 [Amanita muscaria Koide BX008]
MQLSGCSMYVLAVLNEFDSLIRVRGRFQKYDNQAQLKRLMVSLSRNNNQYVPFLPSYWQPCEFSGRFLFIIIMKLTSGKSVRG